LANPQKSAATLPFSAPPAAASNPGFVLEPAYYSGRREADVVMPSGIATLAKTVVAK
jgi:hypothetical protein